MSLPIVICGALGKMGIETAGVVLADRNVALRALVERTDHPKMGVDYGTCIGKGVLGLPLTDAIAEADFETSAIIDFSSPLSTSALLKKAAATKMRLVIGTTGLSSDDYRLAEAASRCSALLISPNMSLGVNLLFLLTELVSSRLKNEFDIEIVEAHHRFKKDAPSGTARRLGEIAAYAYGLTYEQAVKNGRWGLIAGDRPKNEIGMHAVRGGDIVGDHTVLFAGIGERIELRHMAHSRVPLAQGAVAAAKWLASQGPGHYTMRDVLGF